MDGYGAGGNKIYNGLNSTRLGGENISQYMFNNRWTGEGSTNSNPGANRDVEASNYYLEDGDYFRINTLLWAIISEIKLKVFVILEYM